METTADTWKRMAAERAVDFVESGMVVGLGGGTTALWALRRIGALVREGALTNILGVPCSLKVAQDAEREGIELTTLDEKRHIDLTIDGADEVNRSLDCIKGGGGALLREKIVAEASDREIIVVDAAKVVTALGERMVLPVEVVPFGWKSQLAYLEDLGARVIVRRNENDNLFFSDQGNVILDCAFGKIREPHWLSLTLNSRAGIVEHGLFLHLATEVIIAGEKGLEILRRSDPPFGTFVA